MHFQPVRRSSTSGHYSTTLQNIINGIFTGIQGKGVQFAISLGDFCYSGSSSGAGVPQFNDFMSARGLLSAPFLPVLGNHECNANTNGNCPSGSYTGLMQDYINTIVTPSTKQSSP